jgi:hypothetical protein
LAEVCIVGDDEAPKHPDPLPEDHWVNSPFENEAGFKSLLHLAVEKSPEDKAEQYVQLLLSAGARPDLYNEALGVAPVHVAAKLVN